MEPIMTSWNGWNHSGGVIDSDGNLVTQTGYFNYLSPWIREGEYGQMYVVEIAYQSDAWPFAGLRVGSKIYANDADKKGRGGGGSDGAYISPGTWFPMFLPIRISSGQAFRVNLARPARSPNQESPLKIAPPKVWRDVDFNWDLSYANKRPFISIDGAIDISPAGLMYISKKPFVPIGIYPDQTLKNFTKYADRGFNTNMTVASVAQAKRSVDAGMFFWLPLGIYAFERGWGYRKWGHMRREWGAILSDPALNQKCLGTYMDDEAYDQSEDLIMAVYIWRELSYTKPVYVMSGSYNRMPWWSEVAKADMCGTYMSPEHSAGASSGEGGAKVLQHHPLQRTPAVFSQHNIAFKASEILDDAGRYTNGISYYRDGGRFGPIEDRDVWDDILGFAPAFTKKVLAYHSDVVEPPVPPIDNKWLEMVKLLGDVELLNAEIRDLTTDVDLKIDEILNLNTDIN